MRFEEQFEQDKQKHQISESDWFKFKEGDNKMRILSEPKIIVERFKVGICYEGCNYCGKDEQNVSIRYLTWVIDRADGKVKLFKMPYKTTKQLVAYKMDADGGFGFEDFPMPYDININAEKAGTTKVVYTLIPARKNVPLTEEEQTTLDKCTVPESIIAKMKAKQRAKVEGIKEEDSGAVSYPEDEIDPNEIPF